MGHNKRLVVGASLVAICAVNAPSLRIGLFGDDFAHRRFILDHLQSVPVATAWWNMFDGRVPLGAHDADPATLFGRLPWWRSPDFSFALLRPLSTATHFVDYLLWPETPWLMHLHNLVWLGGMIVLAASLYYRVFSYGWCAALALGMLALDDSNTISTAWIASRNTLLTAAFTLLTLRAYVSRRWRPAAPFALLCAHASSEGAIVAWAYLVAYAAWLDTEPVRTRLRALLPMAAVSAGWLALSAAGGYGVRGSGIYVDPRTQPILFLQAAAQRFPELLERQLALPSEVIGVLPSALQNVAFAASHLYLACFLAIALWAAWRSAAVRFFGSALLLSLLPQCAAGSFARLLLLSSFAAHGLSASVVESVVKLCFERGRSVWLVAPLLAVLAAIHGIAAVVAPPYALAFSRAVHASVLRAAESLPTGKSLRSSTIVVLNYPDYLRSAFVSLYRRELCPPGPERMHVLGTTVPPITVARPAVDTLELEPDLGYLRDPSALLVRRSDDRFAVGQRFDLGELSVEVRQVDGDGRPKRIRVRSARLDDGSLLWVSWSEAHQRFEPVTLPAVASTVRLTDPQNRFAVP
jgi:hypothetical protein